MVWMAYSCSLSVGWLATSSWTEEFVHRYETHGLAILNDFEADWIQRTTEYGLQRPTRTSRIFAHRAFDLWSQIGPMYRAAVSVTQFMIPDEILWRIAVYWPDLGNHWREASWRLYLVDNSQSASCLPDLIHSTYVLVMPGLLSEMAHRPHVMGCWKSRRVICVTSGQRCYPQGLICRSYKSSSGHFAFFFSIAARTITALTVMRSRRKLRHLDIVGSHPKQKQTQKHKPNTNKNQTTPTKRLPKKARTRVKRCETCENATLKLSNVLLQEVVPNTVRRSFQRCSVSNHLLCIYHTSRSIFEKVASSRSGLLSSI